MAALDAINATTVLRSCVLVNHGKATAVSCGDVWLDRSIIAVCCSPGKISVVGLCSSGLEDTTMIQLKSSMSHKS